MIYDINGNVLCDEIGVQYPTAQSITAFMAEVNKKAASIGMSNSSFVSPAGASDSTQTNAADMALLTLIASCYKEMAETWNKNSYTITPRNRNANINITTTVTNQTLEASYPILGGKTGSWNSSRALACVCKVGEKQVAGYVAGATSDEDRFLAMKELMDIAATIISGGSTTATVTKATSAVALLVPNYYTLSYEQQTPETLYTQAGSTQIVPASTAKIISGITMLDWVPDVNKTFKIIQDDQIGGSGNVFTTGDEISFKDALYAMMLPSSNSRAQAVARVVGNIILNEQHARVES